jgi:hypothetical protein
LLIRLAAHQRSNENAAGRNTFSEESDMSVKEAEIAITQLSANELVELMAWLENYHAQMWDKQIEEDLEAGRLDALLAEVDKEYEAGLGQPL